MKSAHVSRRTWILAGAGLFVAILVGVALGSSGDETPASPAVLNYIADKNEDAATGAAARMKAESEAAARAADARADAIDAAAEPSPPDNGQVGQ